MPDGRQKEKMNNIAYITGAPFFWQLMAVTTIIAMFIGAMLHNGDFKGLRKHILSLGAYVLMLLTTTIARVTPIYFAKKHEFTPENLAQIWANPITIFFLTFFWFFGLFWGVCLVNKTCRYRKKTI